MTRESRTQATPPFERGVEVTSGYEVIQLLSRGRRLDVYDAWSHERDSRCVLKLLRPERSDDAEAREKLIREGELLERLTHPHIVRAYETILDPGPIVVMETLAGKTLGHMLESRPPLEAAEAAHLGLQLASATSYLHGHGYLHLDLKPENVVAEGGRAKVIDLSLARPPGAAPPGIGTWCYLSPEQARGDDLGPSADVWGIGVVLFEAVTGELAFDDPDDSEFESGSRPSWETGAGSEPRDGEFPQLSSRAPRVGTVRDLPGDLGPLIDSCLAPDPAERPRLAELKRRLERIAGLPKNERRNC